MPTEPDAAVEEGAAEAGTVEAGAVEAGAVEEAAVPCPRHRSTEAVRRVPAVCADVFAGDAAALLSPRPALRAGDRLTWVGTAVGVAGLAAMWVGEAIGGGPGTAVFWCGIVGFAVALVLYGWALARRSRLARVQRGAPAALALWRTAWYCERCDGTYFDGAAVDGATLDGAAFDGSAERAGDGLLSAAEFRRLVWSAGGYGRYAR